VAVGSEVEDEQQGAERPRGQPAESQPPAGCEDDRGEAGAPEGPADVRCEAQPVLPRLIT
jgi:hypothetical protein